MAAVEDQVADAVTALLNAGTFSQSFTAEHVEHPRVAKESLESLHVMVLDQGYEAEPVNRLADAFDYAVDIGIRRNVETLDRTELGPLKQLVGEVIDHVRHPDRRVLELEGGLAAVLVRLESLTHKDRPLIDEASVYLGLARFVYRVVRE